MDTERVVVVGRRGDSTHILFNALSARFTTSLIYEEPPPLWQLLRARARRLGWTRVLGQVLFQVVIAWPLSFASRHRRNEILRGAGASTDAPDGPVATTISVNSGDLRARLNALRPQVVVISGTRILTGTTLEAVGMPVLNVHAGITPRYRGVHGAYWALVNRDQEHCGVTVHLVDAGIDTGGILYQSTIPPARRDNFTTYPVLQVVEGSRLLCQAVDDAINGRIHTVQGPDGSRRWYHPTLWQYLRYHITRGVR